MGHARGREGRVRAGGGKNICGEKRRARVSIEISKEYLERDASPILICRSKVRYKIHGVEILRRESGWIL